VWHGHFVKYFEDGRESFGKQYGVGYMDIYRNGYKAPIVKVNCDYKNVIRYNEFITIETTFRNVPSAKIIFDFLIWDENVKEIKAEGQSTQIFLDENNELMLTIPEFFVDWKRKNGLIE
jgi:acyl-CoA thioester hydrolase